MSPPRRREAGDETPIVLASLERPAWAIGALGVWTGHEPSTEEGPQEREGEVKLDDREMCARFAGVHVWGIHNDVLWRDDPFCDDCAQSVPRFEEDPAAACSLIPKLIPHLRHVERMEFWRQLELVMNGCKDGGNPCRLIVEAVHAVEDQSN